MQPYRHFNLASYMLAYYTAEVTDEELKRGVEWYLKNIPLKKIYVENHRSTVDVPVKRLREIKSLLESYGLTVSGGISSMEDIERLNEEGLRRVIIGKAIYENRISLKDIERWLLSE